MAEESEKKRQAAQIKSVPVYTNASSRVVVEHFHLFMY